MQAPRKVVSPTRGRRLRADDAPCVADIVRRVEEDIVFRVYHPRERLIEDQLMARFGAKRHVVRQALVDLERSGFVQRRPNSGAQVRALTARETEELYAVREILETRCAALIPLPTPAAALARLEAIQVRHAAAVARNDVRDVFRANLEFHDGLFRLAGNDALADAIADFARRTQPVRLATLMTGVDLERARSEHDDILAALRNGKRDPLISLCANHLHPSRAAYLKSIEHLGPQGARSSETS